MPRHVPGMPVLLPNKPRMNTVYHEINTNASRHTLAAHRHTNKQTNRQTDKQTDNFRPPEQTEFVICLNSGRPGAGPAPLQACTITPQGRTTHMGALTHARTRARARVHMHTWLLHELARGGQSRLTSGAERRELLCCIVAAAWRPLQ